MRDARKLGLGQVARPSGPVKDSGMNVPGTHYAKTVDGVNIAYRRVVTDPSTSSE